MPSIIDFHSHILPNVDDGSKSLEESCKMLRMSSEQNVSRVVLTPHFYAHRDNPERFFERRARRYSELCEALAGGMPELLLGAEVAYFEGMTNTSTLLDFRISGTRLLLVEMPFTKWNNRVVEDIIKINRNPDFKVIIAHIERYYKYQSKDVLQRMISEGIVMQSNGEFFLERFASMKAMKMLNNGYIHILGSDSHNLTSRAPNLGQAINRIENKFGKDFVSEMAAFGEELFEKNTVKRVSMLSR